MIHLEDTFWRRSGKGGELFPIAFAVFSATQPELIDLLTFLGLPFISVDAPVLRLRTGFSIRPSSRKYRISEVGKGKGG